MYEERSSRWRWSVCSLLLLSTVLNYMDRQTLAQLASVISHQFSLTNQQYGNLETTFGLSFVVGSIVIGLIADRFSVLGLYALVLIGWSLAGVATAYALPIGFHIDHLLHGATRPETTQHGYTGLLVCRGVLGFFEAGQWPCAIVTTRRILSARDRTFGNGLLQSGGALGAILTPIVVLKMVNPADGNSWRLPFLVIGIVGLLWIIPWFLMVRRRDLAIEREDELDRSSVTSAAQPSAAVPDGKGLLIRRFLALAILVITVNMTWQFFRAWLPKFLQEFHHYTFQQVQSFSFAYYVAADIGCIAVGLLVKWLAGRGWKLQAARVGVYFVCCAVTALTVFAADMGRGPLLLVLLAAIGFGSMGMFPLYYSFTQEISARNQGKVTGMLAAISWIFISLMQNRVGRGVDQSGSYAFSIYWLGLAPILGGIALLLMWGRDLKRAPVDC